MPKIAAETWQKRLLEREDPTPWQLVVGQSRT
jgi:hypothetical protein